MVTKRDFSKIVYPKRIAVIEGEKIDVSKISTRVMLNLVELKDRRDELEAGEIGIFYELIEIIAQACKANKKITADWLIDNTDIMQLLDLMEYIIEPLTVKVESVIIKKDEKVSKNSKAPPKDQKKESSKK